MTHLTLRKWTAVFFLILLANTAYIWAFAFPTVFYMTNVLLHLGLGTILFGVLLWLFARDRNFPTGLLSGIGCFTLAFLLGAWLTRAGNTLDHRWLLWAHIAAALGGIGAIIPYSWQGARRYGGGWLLFRNGLFACLVLLIFLPPGAALIAEPSRLPPTVSGTLWSRP